MKNKESQTAWRTEGVQSCQCGETVRDQKKNGTSGTPSGRFVSEQRQSKLP